MNLIFLGAPGAGKGTYSEAIKQKIGIPSISTGDIIRATLRKNDEFASQLKGFVEKGLLVPDDIVINMIKKRISESDCNNGFILDGFPRTIAQANELETMGVQIDKVINIEVPNEVIFTRMEGRCVCSKCGAVFNDLTELKPKRTGICDKCDGKLEKRKDDTKEIIAQRLEIYRAQTSPLIDFYKNKGKLTTINADKPLSEGLKDMLEILELA